MNYERFSKFILIIGAVIGTLIGVSTGLSTAPNALLIILAGTAIGLFVGMSIGMAILRTDIAKRSLQRTRLFRMFEAAMEVE